jgi:hypothetical protein
MNDRSLAIFLGHGNPMNAILDNDYTRGWARIGENIPRPKAILSVSAHWYFPVVAVTAFLNPAQFTISAASRESCLRLNIPHREALSSQSASRRIYPHFLSSLTSAGE